MNIIITGGGIANKGAQSMLYITVERLKKIYPNDRIVLLTTVERDYKNFQFDVVVVNYYILSALVNGMSILKKLRKCVFPWKTAEIEKLFNDARLLIDISGYALGSNWSMVIVDQYLLYFECAKKYGVPVYIMPQSFGPFNYDNDSTIVNRIVNTMSYPRVVYAREQEGYRLMTDTMGLTNIRSSADMVLLCESASPTKIYKEYKERVLPSVKENSVAVVPNVRNCDCAEKEVVLGYYICVINWLISHKKNVYILHHSKEDVFLCSELADVFRSKDGVYYLSDEYDCFEYERLVLQFDYIVASRYHAIVHALKNGIPCVAIGWAIKYYELLSVCGLGDYALDVRTTLSDKKIEEKLEKMDSNNNQIKEKIVQSICTLKKNNELFSFD